MRFLVDESCDVALGKALVEAGNDVLEIRLIRPGAEDEWSAWRFPKTGSS
jgi:hypothetical protein